MNEPRHREYAVPTGPLSRREMRLARAYAPTIPCTGRHCALHPVTSLPLEEM